MVTQWSVVSSRCDTTVATASALTSAPTKRKGHGPRVTAARGAIGRGEHDTRPRREVQVRERRERKASFGGDVFAAHRHLATDTLCQRARRLILGAGVDEPAALYCRDDCRREAERIDDDQDVLALCGCTSAVTTPVEAAAVGGLRKEISRHQERGLSPKTYQGYASERALTPAKLAGVISRTQY